MNPLVPSTELETTTVTLDEIVHHRRVRVLDHAGQTSITEACRTLGISRTTFYRWRDRAARYGLAALMPKGRRSPAMPNATSPEVIEIVLAEALVRPTYNSRSNVTDTTDALQDVATFTFDEGGEGPNLMSGKTAGGATTSFGYISSNFAYGPSSRTDAQGNQSDYTYDPQGRMLSASTNGFSAPEHDGLGRAR